MRRLAQIAYAPVSGKMFRRCEPHPVQPVNLVIAVGKSRMRARRSAAIFFDADFHHKFCFPDSIQVLATSIRFWF